MIHECTIGILWDYDNTREITFSDLKKIVESERESYDTFKNDPIYKNILHTPKSVVAYCDLRKNLMRHYMFCPDCGKEINWEKLRKQAKEDG